MWQRKERESESERERERERIGQGTSWVYLPALLRVLSMETITYERDITCVDNGDPGLTAYSQGMIKVIVVLDTVDCIDGDRKS